ncbi:MAG TPA: UpxY family transcription antiterminator [Bryobacteraceae bacterium]|jgi:transcription antitermination factor NusG|nr:UpxY family transcription antiterminator [Bryobacteraceae bacterium]
MDDSCGLYSWFAVEARHNRERAVADLLQAKGLESFLPTYEEPRQWSDRVKLTELPLFPGYLFCRLNSERRMPILTTPGVRRIVCFGSTPVPVPETEIEAVRRFIKSKLKIQPWPFLEIGQTVKIQKGPLAGVEGILQEFRGNYRVVVSIALLQRSIAAEMDGTWIKATHPCALPSKSYVAAAY